MAHDVFISHSASDKPVADAVCAAFENEAIRCWIAPRDVRPGRSFAGEITRAIQQSRAMVLIFSAHSNHSPQVLREVQLAVDSDLHIIQFRIEDVILNDDLRYFLSTPHWLDALTSPLENHLGRLLAAIKSLLESPAEEAVATEMARPVSFAESSGARSTQSIGEEQRPREVVPAARSRIPKWLVLSGLLIFAIALSVWLLSIYQPLRKPDRTEMAPNNISVAPTQVPTAVPAQTQLAVPTPVSASPPINDQDKVSYCLGFDIGSTFKKQNGDINTATFGAGLKDALSGRTPLLNENEIREALAAWTKEIAAGGGRALLKSTRDNGSYSIGYDAGTTFKKQNVNVNPEAILTGINDALSGKEPALSKEEREKTLAALQKKMMEKQAAASKTVAEKNAAAGEKFLAENKKKLGVKTTPSGLQYKVLKEGTGPSPKETDSVVTNYKGTLIDGTEFDSSYKRGEPATFPVNRLIKGWTEGLQLMKPGSKYQLFIPPSLAYGERGVGNDIGPNSTLIFEVELLGIKPPDAATPTPRP